MKKIQKLIMLLPIIFMLLVSGCSFPDEPEINRPQISIIFPQNNVVVGDSLLIQAEASDPDGNVSRVDFYVDGTNDSLAFDLTPPFSYKWKVSNAMEIGSEHSIFCKVYDDQNLEMISNIVNVIYKWKTLQIDQDDNFKMDIEKVAIRNTDQLLEFYLQYFVKWEDPTERSEGITSAIFIDQDADTLTGLRPDTTAQVIYTLEEILKSHVTAKIGADYAITAGSQGNQLWKWDNDDLEWSEIDVASGYINVPENSIFYETGIPLSILESPDSIKVISVNMSYMADTTFVDWVPNTGHLQYKINDAFSVGYDENTH